MTGPYWREEGAVIVLARVTPNASRDGIDGLWRGPCSGGSGERLAIRVSAAPDKGRANKAVIAVLAKALGAPKSAVSVRAGGKDRLKTLAISGDAEAILARLALLVRGEAAKEEE